MPDLNEENILKKIPPHDTEAEGAVLGAMLVSRDAIAQASEYITGEDFYNRYYGMVFDAMVELDNKGYAVDTVTLQAKLREMNVPGEVSGLSFLKDILALDSFSGNAVYYSRIIAEKSVLRKLIKVSTDIQNDCYSDNGDVSRVLDSAEKNIFEVLKKNDTGEFVPIEKITMDVIDQIDEAAKHPGAITGISTGFIDLDAMTSGMQKSDFILIAARPSMGKTAFALNIAQHVAFRNEKPIVVFSLEMSKEQLVQRILSMESHVSSEKLRNGSLKDDDWERISESANIIANSKLILDDTVGLTSSALRAKCRKYKLDYDIQMVIIDYLQLMSGGGERKGAVTRQQEVSDISRGLKELARELQVPVVALSQLSRNVEANSRSDRKPRLSDIRESGSIEQDADLVMFIYRDDYYHPDTEKPGVAEIIIAKQRRGPVGSVELKWLKEYTQFANLEKDYNRNDD
ncbi:MAG: replicative DNA helicase [Lachnospiraceae bacterium]|nr:replicative DNA helicase [Lachnospiraceae bacterium]